MESAKSDVGYFEVNAVVSGERVEILKKGIVCELD